MEMNKGFVKAVVRDYFAPLTCVFKKIRGENCTLKSCYSDYKQEEKLELRK